MPKTKTKNNYYFICVYKNNTYICNEFKNKQNDRIFITISIFWSSNIISNISFQGCKLITN